MVKQIRSIWMVAREFGDLAGAGGVKDVVYQLARTLARWSGRSVHVVLPRYGFIDPEAEGFVPVADPLCKDRPLELAVNMDQPDVLVKEAVQYYYRKTERVHIYLVEAARYRDKGAVYTYTQDDEKLQIWQKKSQGHHDYFAMNVLLQKAALELMIALSATPDIIHCHDGHTALLPALIREKSGYASYFRDTGCLTTIHNAGYGYHQEIADLDYAESISELPRELVDSFLLDNKFDPFLVAGSYSILNTVSENYARELQETDSDRLSGWLGHELKLKDIGIEGITNGIDPDSVVVEDGGVVKSKEAHKKTLLSQLKQKVLPAEIVLHGTLDLVAEAPLLTFVGRLSEQKGIDTLVEVLPVLFEKNSAVRGLVLGGGALELEDVLIQLSNQFPGRLCYLQGYSPEAAALVYGAGDFFVVPSKFEPCGLTDFIAQLYGNIPVVHHVGGLVKVVDGVTGIAYLEDSQDALLQALEKALALDSHQKIAIQKQAVETIERKYTWSKVMHRYLHLYKRCRAEQVPC
jgi:starch synthase